MTYQQIAEAAGYSVSKMLGLGWYVVQPDAFMDDDPGRVTFWPLEAQAWRDAAEQAS